MRRGHNNEVFVEKGVIVGINLGSDFTAEHEWGIERMREAFGIKGEGYGIEKRKISKIPTHRDYTKKATVQSVQLIDEGDETILLMHNYFEDVSALDAKQRQEYLVRMQIGRWDKTDQELKTAWDEGTFGINATKPQDREAVRKVYTAMQSNDLAIWLGGGGVFKNAGLVLVIASLVPEENLKQLSDADYDREKLLKTAEETGIAKRLEQAGKKYYALSPAWIKGDLVKKTKYNVQFWLNPYDQDNNNYGWFTVEELDQWAKGQGPCVGGRKTRNG